MNRNACNRPAQGLDEMKQSRWALAALAALFAAAWAGLLIAMISHPTPAAVEAIAAPPVPYSPGTHHTAHARTPARADAQ